MRTIEEILVDIDAVFKEDRPSACLPTSFEGWQRWRLHELKSELFDILVSGIPLDRLREVCAAERDGRCVVLPDCSKCVYQQNGNMSLACSNCIGEQKFDNDLFTREAAEAALAQEGGQDV